MAVFPETRISAVLETASDDPSLREQAFARLVSAYWKPIYLYVRMRHLKQADEAQDLTQGFFTHAWEKRIFRNYDPAKGRFRTYVRVCVDRFVINQHEADTRLKRGGAVAHSSLDFESAEAEISQIEIADINDPERLFEREWTRNLIQAAIEELRDKLIKTGKEPAFKIFEAYDLGDPVGEEISYNALAERLGIPVTTVTNHLAHARRRLREIIIRRLRDLSSTNEEFKDDMALVFIRRSSS
ncbi:MAG TPA: sigma-70 family RNA polymerase sigma factor [Pyrinomonadaceae bacterium]|nr:sigma-70 family RNA polymerase sigma factor [Pyrinomonadaceae bacterium]